MGIIGDGFLVLTHSAQTDSGCPRIYRLAVNPGSWERTGVLQIFRLRGMRHRGWSNFYCWVCSDRVSVRPHCEDVSRRSKHAPSSDGCPMFPRTLCGVSRRPLCMDAEVHRPNGGPEDLQLIAEACSANADWVVYVPCVLSFPLLARVGEVCSARRSRVENCHFSHCGLKRNERWDTGHMGPYGMVWARWLRRLPQGSDLLGSAAFLEEGMERLLKATDRQETRWHAWRGARACHLRALGLPCRFLCWWGRGESIKIAAYYARPPDDWSLVIDLRLPHRLPCVG